MFYKASLILRMVVGWFVFFCIRQKKQCFVKGFPKGLLRTVARFVERDAHTMGDSFGVCVGACVARARSIFRHCVFRLRFFVIAFVAAAPFRCPSLVYNDSCMVGGSCRCTLLI